MPAIAIAALRDSLQDDKCYEEYAAAPTICDGLAGSIGKIYFEVARSRRVAEISHDSDSHEARVSEAKQFVDDMAIVDESETRTTIRAPAETQQQIEGSGTVGVKAVLSRKINLAGNRVKVVLSEGNIDLKLLKEILDADT